MKKPTKQEILSRILVCSSVLVLTSPMIAQVASIPASAETISSSATGEAPPDSSDTLLEKQEVIEEEQVVTEETTTSEIEESESTENTEASAATEETETAESEAVEETEASTEETTESTMDSSEEKETKVAKAVQATTYDIEELMDQGIISDVKITWSREDGETVDFNKQESVALPIAVSYKINSNTLLKAGDTIRFGSIQFAGYRDGSSAFNGSPLNLSVGTWSPTKCTLVLSAGYDPIFSSSITTALEPNMGGSVNYDAEPTVTTTWFGETRTTNVIPKTYPGDATTFPDFTAYETVNSSGGLLRLYGNTTNAKYSASLLDGSNPNYDSSVGGTPSGNFVTVWHIDAETVKNVINVTLVDNPGGSVPALGPTGTALARPNTNSKSPSMSAVKVFFTSYIESMLPADSSDDYITTHSTPYTYGIIKNSDGSMTLYYNQGNLQDAHPANQEDIEDMVFDGNAKGVEAATPIFTDSRYSSTTNSTTGRFNIEFVDPTQSYEVSLTVGQYSTDGYSRTGNRSITTNPTAGSAQGQSAIKVYYEDTNGNVIKTVSSHYGWPAGNSAGEASTPDLKITPPAIPGYTYKSVDVANAASDGSATVPYPEEGKTTDVTYVYTPNPQTAVVNFIDDDDNGKVLKTVPLDGVTGGTADYTTTADIETLKKQGYVLVSDQTGGTKPSFGTTSPTTYEVHLKHDTEEKEETKAVERTIHYVYEDGTEAAPDQMDTVTYTRTITEDLVTGVQTESDWKAEDDDTTFDAVDSPEITNYTPDKETVDEVTGVKVDDEDSEVTVTYTANKNITTETKEVTQTIHYVYEDGTEAAPGNVDTVTFTRTVTTNEATGEKTYGDWTAKDDDTTFDAVVSPEIANYTPDKQGVPEMIGLTAESTDSELTVTYKANMEESTETKEIKQVIHYVYEDGSKAADDSRDSVIFTRTVTKNLATGEVTYGNWQAKDGDTCFDEVNSPEIDNCTADDTCIEETANITPESKDLEFTVTYAAKMATTEETKSVARVIHYVYEDGTEAAPDKTDTVTFTRSVTTNQLTGEETYGDWEAVADDTTFDAVVSPEIDNYTADKKEIAEESGLTADSKDSEVTVTYTPNMVESIEAKEVKQTIRYVYEDGTEAAPDKVDTVTFTRTVTTNEATGDKTYGEWQAKEDDTTFDEVTSPEIEHYTADKATVEEVTGLTAESKDSEVTVTYTPNMVESTETKEVKQTIHYLYEDGTEAVPDKVDTVTFTRKVTTNEATNDKAYGEWEAKDNDTTFDAVDSPTIDKYHADKAKVEEITGLTAESKDSEVTVTYTPNIVESTETKEVKQTIHYVYEDGTEAASDKVDTVSFTRTVTTNEATGDKTYGEWQAKDNDTTFDEVTSPEIKNYTADKAIVDEVTGLTAEDKDSEVTVTYKKKTKLATGSSVPSSDPAKATGNGSPKKVLPQTGEETNSMTLYSGAALVVAAVLGIFIKRSKHKTKD